jgi:hypothetical protein
MNASGHPVADLGPAVSKVVDIYNHGDSCICLSYIAIVSVPGTNSPPNFFPGRDPDEVLAASVTNRPYLRDCRQDLQSWPGRHALAMCTMQDTVSRSTQ